MFSKASFFKYSNLNLLLFIVGSGFAQSNNLINFTISISSTAKHTGDSLFIAGNFNGWNPHDANTAMLPNKEGIYEKTISTKANELVQWKITRGSWDKVETGLNGTDISNHTINLKEITAANVRVQGWKDDFINNQKTHTISPQVHIMDTAFNLKALGRQRKIWIYLPKDYVRSNKRYPVLYMHDGQNLFDAFTSGYGEWGVDEILDSMFNKTHKSTIVVGIDNLPDRRLQEYDPYDEKDYGIGEGKIYIQSLVEDVKPFVDKHFRTLANAKNTSIAGSSMGGIISLWAVMQYPNIFGNAGIFSPAFWIAPQFKSDVPLMFKNNTSKLFFYCGGSESKTMESDMDTIINKIKAVSTTSIKRKVSINGQHNEKAWHLVLPDFLSTIPAK